MHRQSWSYLLGGASLFLFGLQIASGALLMLYYQPAQATAHESVQRIATEVPGGWFIRSAHAWGADLFIAFVGLHFVVKLFTRAYRRPRELTWLTGMALLLVTLAFGFSGYLLPWTDLSYYATLVGTQIGGTIPVVGDAIVHLLRGSAQITGDTITRFHAAHVFWLPLTAGVVLAIHFALVQSQGQSIPMGISPREVRDARPFFTEFLLLDLCVWLVLLGTVATLASLLPAELGVKADPLKACARRDPARMVFSVCIPDAQARAGIRGRGPVRARSRVLRARPVPGPEGQPRGAKPRVDRAVCGLDHGGGVAADLGLARARTAARSGPRRRRPPPRRVDRCHAHPVLGADRLSGLLPLATPAAEHPHPQAVPGFPQSGGCQVAAKRARKSPLPPHLLNEP